MFHGKSRIIRKSSIDDDLRLVLLASLARNTTYFAYDDPKTVSDRAVLEFLDREQFRCNKKYIEYWFQDKSSDENLWPHVDFNDMLRLRLAKGEQISRERLMSPITISCYLDIQDLEGGEFCISECSWLNYEREIQPEEALREEISKYIYESYKPVTGDVLYFEGSRYYHWINKVLSGTRKSVLINFWDEIDK